jgi:hypothetical protein
MSAITTTDVANQVQKFWSPLFTKELRESLLLGGLVNKDYQGQIQAMGDRVRVSEINAPAGALKTVGTDADSFTTDSLTTQYIDITANKRAVAAFEFASLVDLQSQIGAQNSEIRAALLFAVEKQINDYLYSLVVPHSTHVIASTANLDASVLLDVRGKAAKAKWLRDKGWWGLINPDYMNDLLGTTSMVNSQYVGQDAPTVGGQIATPRFGFNILEDNSRTAASGIFFHPDFMHLVTQTQATFKVSDLHSNLKFGYVISVDLIFGASLGINGNKKVVQVKAAA